VFAYAFHTYGCMGSVLACVASGASAASVFPLGLLFPPLGISPFLPQLLRLLFYTAVQL
jgi:hypothetical protein